MTDCFDFKPRAMDRELWNLMLDAFIEASMKIASEGHVREAMTFITSGIRETTFDMRHGYVLECNLTHLLHEGPIYEAGGARKYSELRAVIFYTSDSHPIMGLGLVRDMQGKIVLSASGPAAKAIDLACKEAMSSVSLSGEYGSVDDVIKQLGEKNIEAQVEQFTSSIDDYEKEVNRWMT